MSFVFGVGSRVFHPPCPLAQIRLTLAKKDFVRALIQSRKINRKVLLDEDMQDIKVGASETGETDEDTEERQRGWVFRLD